MNGDFGKLRAPVRFLRLQFSDWRAAVAVLAGVFLALAFPLPGWAGMAWLAPGLLLLATLRTSGVRSFRLGYLAGLVFNLVALRWLLYIPFPVGALAGWLALSAYLALYPAVWAWLAWKFAPRAWGSEPAAVRVEASPAAPERSWASAISAMAESTWLARTLWALAVAVAWVAMEMIVSRLFTGFPWTALGITQHRLLPVIQLATVAGVPGVTFLVVWLSTALFLAGVRLAHRLAGPDRCRDAAAWRPLASGPGHRSGPDLLVSLRFALMTDLGLPLLALLAVTFWGARQLVAATPAARELKLALVQPSIPQRLIWDPRETTNRFQTLMTLSEAALRTGPDLLVWPEASLPDYSPENFRALTNLVAEHRVWMILGADDAAPRAEGGFDFFNSALLFDPAGRYVASYRKQRLVIFGEYIPLVRWLPFVKYLTPIEGGFTPGEGPVTFELSSPPAKISPLICFEDVFARGVRHHVEPGTDFLLNLTNDGWFGEGSAQWQQAANAVFRAVENRRPLIRCTNNGLTCWIDEFGRLREALGLADGNVYAAGFLSLRLPLPVVGEEMPATFYRQHGDVFGWACTGLTLAMAACRALSGRWRFPLTRAAGRV